MGEAETAVACKCVASLITRRVTSIENHFHMPIEKLRAFASDRYGVPPVGKKVYVRVNQFVDGWEDLPVTFSAIVPASA